MDTIKQKRGFMCSNENQNGSISYSVSVKGMWQIRVIGLARHGKKVDVFTLLPVVYYENLNQHRLVSLASYWVDSF